MKSNEYSNKTNQYHTKHTHAHALCNLNFEAVGSFIMNIMYTGTSLSFLIFYKKVTD